MEIYQLLIPTYTTRVVLEDWLINDYACNMTFRRAKTKGHVVVETADVLFAARVQNLPDCTKVHIKNV